MCFGLSHENLEKIRGVFREYAKLERVIVYGSRAKGAFRPGSDIDLVLIGDKLDFSDLLNLETQLDGLNLAYCIDLEILARIENKDLLSHIHRVGKVLYERGS